MEDLSTQQTTLTFTGGTFVPGGNVKTIQVWCLSENGGAFDGAQLLIMQVGGSG